MVPCEVSFVICSIGFGGGAVAMVQPIHAPMAIIGTNAANTDTAMVQNLTSVSAAFSLSVPSHRGMKSIVTWKMAIIKHAASIAHLLFGLCSKLFHLREYLDLDAVVCVSRVMR